MWRHFTIFEAQWDTCLCCPSVERMIPPLSVQRDDMALSQSISGLKSEKTRNGRRNDFCPWSLDHLQPSPTIKSNGNLAALC